LAISFINYSRYGFTCCISLQVIICLRKRERKLRYK
jgi:hypothetical protein